MNLFALLEGLEALEKPLVSDELAIPDYLKVARGSLHFSTATSKHAPSNTTGLLTDFAALAKNRDDHAVLRYAKRFGPLGLCEQHALPVLHGGKPCWPKVTSTGLAEPL